MRDPFATSDLVKISDAARILGVSIDTLRRWGKSGKITPIRTPGGTRLYSLYELSDINPRSIQYASSTPSTKELLERKEQEESTVILNEAERSEGYNLYSSPSAQNDNKEVRHLLRSTSQSKLLTPALLTFTLLIFGFSFYLLSPLITSPSQFNLPESISLPFFKKSQSRDATLRIDPNVLAASTIAKEGKFLEFNADTVITGNQAVEGEGIFGENLTAPNIIYDLVAGEGISITEGQTPTISTSLTETLATVTARGSVTTTGITLGNVLNLGNLASDPSSAANGATYYNTASNKFRCYVSGSWTDCKTESSALGDITGVSVGNGLSGGGSSGDVSINLDVTTTTTTTTTSLNSGLEASSTGLRLLGGCSNNNVLKWDSDLVIWKCTVDVGQGTAGIINIQESEIDVSDNASTLDFLGTDFDTTESPDGEVNVSIAAVLTFADGDFVDLASIVHDDSALQGIRLPQAASLTNLTSGEGFIAWDSDDNKLMAYNGTAWADVSGASTTLQDSYNNDTDGSDAIIALTTADDSIIFRNPASSGTDSAFLLKLDQLATNKLALDIDSANTATDIFDISSTTLTTGELLNIDATYAPTDGSTNEAIDINITHSPTTLADNFQSINLTTTDGTALGNTVYNLQGTLTLTGNAAKTGIGDYQTVTSSSITGDTLISFDAASTVTGILAGATTRSVYGLRSQPTAGAESAAGTTNVYGVYSKATGDVAVGGTINTYGAYIADGGGDAEGTATNFGIYLEPISGADTNYGICFDCDGTFGTSSIATGISWGSDANTVTLYRSASDILRTGDGLTVDLDLIVSGGDITGTGDESIDIGEATANTITLLINATAELNLSATALTPSTDSGQDLGSSSSQFADLFLDGGNINLDNLTDIDIDDALASSFTISEGTNNFINIKTSATDDISFGNATTNPSYSFLGTGAVTIAGSADGTDALILTLGDILVTNGDFDLSGGDFNVTLDSGDTADLAGTAPATVSGNGTNAATNTLLAVGTAGGASSGTTGQTGGTGGALSLTAGVGGAVTGASGIGGLGGGLTLAGGAGGAGAATGGVGGAISVTAGAAGTGGNANGGTLTLNSGAVTGTGTSTLNLGTANSTIINLGDSTVTKTIDIGGVTSSDASTINIATESTAADTLTIGNTNASTTLALTGGDDWSLAATGVFTLSASAAAITAIVITDTDYTNSLSIGDNTITGTTANIDLTYFDVTGSTGAVTIDPQTTGTYLDFTLETAWTSGTLINADFASATTQGAAAIAGMLLDLNTNLTAPAAGQSITGIDIKLPSASTTSNTPTYSGINLSTAGAITNGTAGTFSWRGTNITLPNVTQNSGGTVTAYGGLATLGTLTATSTTTGTLTGFVVDATSTTITTSGVVLGFSFTPPSSGVGAGSLLGININSITTAGAGTEQAVRIGSGWDIAIAFIGASDLDIPDNTASALTISQGTGNYFLITTTNDSEVVTLDLPTGGASSLTGNLFTSNIAKTINIGTGTAADTINIGTGGTNGDTINLGNTTVFTNLVFDTAVATTTAFAENANSISSGTAFAISTSAATTGSALTITGPTSTGVTTAATSGFVKIASDVGSAGTGGVLLHLAPDFSAGSATTGYGIRVVGTDSTAIANTDFGINSSLTLTGNAAKVAETFFAQLSTASTTADTLAAYATQTTDWTTSAAIITTGTRSLYGYYAQPIAGAESTGGTTNVYGVYSIPGGDVGVGGTFNAYGVYVANGTFDIDGTSTAFGVYLEPRSGADENIGLCFDCDATFGTQTAATGIQFGNESTTTQNLQIFRSNAAAAAQITIQDEAGTDLMNASTADFQINLGANIASGGQRVCHGGVADSTGLESIGDCNATSVDLAEYYGSDGTLESGDVVIVDPAKPAFEFTTPTGSKTSKAYVTKSTNSYQQSLVGIVSTNPLEILGEGVFDQSENPVPVALVGRVPVKVSTENGPIEIGDYLTSSSIPGVAMKATQPGQVVGKALSGFDENTPGKIIVFVNPSYADPSQALAGLLLDENGYLVIPKLKTETLSLGNIGSIDLSQTQLTVGTQPIDLIAKLSVVDSLQLTVDSLQTNVATQSAQLASNTSALEEIKANVASLYDSIASASASLQNDTQSTSANTPGVDELDLTPPEELFATPSALLGTSGSATIADLKVTETFSSEKLFTALDVTVSGTFKALSDVFLGSTTIAGDLTVDGTLSISQNSLNSLTTLYLQNSPLAENIDIFNGQVTIDKDGLIKTQKILASEYQIVAGKTSGTGTLAAGTVEVPIFAEKVGPNSRILITPTTPTTLTLAVSEKVPGAGFVVSTIIPTPQNITFDWWIINEVAEANP